MPDLITGIKGVGSVWVFKTTNIQKERKHIQGKTKQQIKSQRPRARCGKYFGIKK